jgi:hypothetical protein
MMLRLSRFHCGRCFNAIFRAVARMLDPRNQVNGSKIYRGVNGVTMVQINDMRNPITPREAIRHRFVKTEEM